MTFFTLNTKTVTSGNLLDRDMEWFAAANYAQTTSSKCNSKRSTIVYASFRSLQTKSPKPLRLQATSGTRVALHSVPVQVAKELMEAGHSCLDVRTPEEFEAGHVEGAINVPIMYHQNGGMTKNPDFLEQVAALFSVDDELVVACQSGKRSFIAASELVNAGYACVTDMGGGFLTWAQSGLPVTVGRS